MYLAENFQGIYTVAVIIADGGVLDGETTIEFIQQYKTNSIGSDGKLFNFGEGEPRTGEESVASVVMSLNCAYALRNALDEVLTAREIKANKSNKDSSFMGTL